jgi:hypothetical protein
MFAEPPNDRQYFQAKGRAAEEVVQGLAEQTFIKDWCYPNPKLPSGKEIADLLIVFGETAIIWQIKDLKLDELGSYKAAEVEKNLRQLSGARRQLFDLRTPITLENPRRGKELFDPTAIKEVFLISVLMGEPPQALSGFKEFKGLRVHVFTRDFVQIVLQELDTVGDFAAYLREKESLLTGLKQLIVSGGEEELLATYLLSERSFAEQKHADILFITEDAWDSLQTRPEYIAKKKEDRISYATDKLIGDLYSSNHASYEAVARELASLTRYERRVLAKMMRDSHSRADAAGRPVFRRTFVFGDRTFCLLLADISMPREQRMGMLRAMTFVARGTFKENSKVIGIATELQLHVPRSFDAGVLYLKEWTDDDERQMNEIRQQMGIGKVQERTPFSEEEYPTPGKAKE